MPVALPSDVRKRYLSGTTIAIALDSFLWSPHPYVIFLGRTNLDCDLLEEFLTEVGGGKRFTGHQESGNQNAFSCCVLAGMRSMQQRRVRNDMRDGGGNREGERSIFLCFSAARQEQQT